MLNNDRIQRIRDELNRAELEANLIRANVQSIRQQMIELLREDEVTY